MLRILLLTLLLAAPARAEPLETRSQDEPEPGLPAQAIAKAKPIEHYRKIFEKAVPPDLTKHGFLQGLIFKCEVATFNPIVYDHTSEMPGYNKEYEKQAKHVFKSRSFILRKIEPARVTYATIADSDMKGKSNYEDAAATVLTKDKFGGFTNIDKTKNYPKKTGSALFFVEMRVTAENEVVFETSYDIQGFSPTAQKKKPVSPGGKAIGGRIFADDYAICKSTGELVF